VIAPVTEIESYAAVVTNVLLTTAVAVSTFVAVSVIASAAASMVRV